MAFLGGDDTHGWNHMQVIKNLISQVSASTLIYNYSQILDTVEGMSITNMNREKFSQLAETQIKDMSSWEIHSFAVTGTLGTDKPAALGGDKAAVVYSHSYTVNKAKSLMNKVLNDKVIKRLTFINFFQKFIIKKRTPFGVLFFIVYYFLQSAYWLNSKILTSHLLSYKK